MAGKTVDNVDRAGHADLRRAAAARRARRATRSCERIIAEGGPRAARSTARLRDLRDRYADEIRARYPDIPRRVSGYNLPWLLPENGFNVARALVGTEGTCVTILEADAAAGRQPARAASLLVLGYPRRVSRPATTSRPIMRARAASGCEGIDDRLIDDMKAQGPAPARREAAARRATAGCWSNSAAQTGDESDAQGARASWTRCGSGERLAGDETLRPTERRSAASGRCASRASARRRIVPGQADHLARLGGLRRPARAARATTCAISARCSISYGYDGSTSTATSARAACTARIDFDLVTARRACATVPRASSTRPPTWSCATAARSPASTATARRAASCCRRCTASELMQRVRRVQGDLGPGNGSMNPGKVVDAVPDRLQNLRLGDRLQSAEPVRRTSPSRPTSGSVRATPRLRCVGVGKCRRHERRHDVPELHGHPRGEALHARPGAPAVRDAATATSSATAGATTTCTRRSTCASPARAARATARSTSTWRPTRRSSYSHYYDGRLRPRAAYAMGLIDWWARAGARRRRGWSTRSLTHRCCAASCQADGGRGIRARRLPRVRAAAPSASASRSDLHAADAVAARRSFSGPTPSTTTSIPRRRQAAVEVLEAAGYRVTIPAATLCCGRPAVRLGHAGPRPAPVEPGAARAAAARSVPASRWSAWSRVA